MWPVLLRTYFLWCRILIQSCVFVCRLVAAALQQLIMVKNGVPLSHVDHHYKHCVILMGIEGVSGDIVCLLLITSQPDQLTASSGR